MCDTFVRSGVPPRPERVPSPRIFLGLGDGSLSLEDAVLFCSLIVCAMSWMVSRRDVSSCRMVAISIE